MKKVICILCALALLLSLGACAKKSAGVFPKPEDVTDQSHGHARPCRRL